MKLRQLSIALAVALLVVAGFWVMGDALRGLNVPDAPTEPQFAERRVSEPPPLRETPASMAERRGFWLRMLTTGDERDVQWAVAQLRAGGEAGRAAVLAAAERSLRSNKALVQQALEFLLADPRADCFQLARDVLDSTDPHAVNRALLILARLGPEAESVAPQVAALAVDRPYPIPQYAMTALAAMGTAQAEEAAKDAVQRMDAGQRAFGYVALAQMARPGIAAFLRDAFERETQPGTKLAAAEGLVRSGDDTPIAWLHGELRRTTAGTPQFEGALRILAQAADETAGRILARRAEDPLETGKRRANAIEPLRPFPLPAIKATLVRAGRSGQPVDARVAAWDQLVRKGPPSAFRDLLSMLVVPGAAAAEDRRVAALVLGRLRRADAADGLIAALARLQAGEEEERSLYLRALCLTGSEKGAEVVARAIAADHTGFGRGGTAFDVYGVLGDLTPALRRVYGRQFVRALAGEFGEPSGTGLQFLLLAMITCGGPEAAPWIERYVHHDEREIRDAAVTALAFVGRPESLDVLTRAWRRKQDDLLRDVLRDTIEKLQYLAP